MNLAILLFFVVTNAFGASATLVWDASPSTSVTGYRVFYGMASGLYTGQIDAGAALTAPVNNLLPNTAYFFAVKSYSGAVESAFSNEVTATTPPDIIVPPPPPPSVFSVTAIAPLAVTEVTLTPVADPTVTKWVWKFPGALAWSVTKLKPLPVQAYYKAAGTYTVTLVRWAGSVVKDETSLQVVVK